MLKQLNFKKNGEFYLSEEVIMGSDGKLSFGLTYSSAAQVTIQRSIDNFSYVDVLGSTQSGDVGYNEFSVLDGKGGQYIRVKSTVMPTKAIVLL